MCENCQWLGVRGWFSPGTPVSSNDYNWLVTDLQQYGINVTKTKFQMSPITALARILAAICENVTSDLGWGGGFRRVLRFPPSATEKVAKRRNSWNRVVSDQANAWGEKKAIIAYIDEGSLNPTGTTLKLFSSEAQELRKLWKSSKSYYDGILWNALIEYLTMSFSHFQIIFTLYCIDQICHQQLKGCYCFDGVDGDSFLCVTTTVRSGNK